MQISVWHLWPLVTLYFIMVFIGYITAKGICQNMIVRSHEIRKKPLKYRASLELLCWITAFFLLGFLGFAIKMLAGQPIPFCLKMPKEFKKK